MPKVPIPEQRVEEAQAPGLQVGIPNVPAAAFGTGIGKATAQLGQQISESADVLGKHIQKMQLREQEKEVDNWSTEFEQAAQTKTLSTEEDENGRVGILNRTLDDAKGATIEWQDWYAQQKNEFLKRPMSQLQRDALTKQLDTRGEAIRNRIATHQATQFRESANAATDARLKAGVSAAAMIVRPDDLIAHFGALNERLQAHLIDQGAPDEFRQQKAKELASDVAITAITPHLTNDTNQARTLLNSMRPYMAADLYEKAKEDIHVSEIRNKERIKKARNEAYDQTLRQDLILSFAGKLTLSELQRQYRADQVDDSGFKSMAHIVADPTFSFLRPEKATDPTAFNEIRQAQLSHKYTQSQILRMITDAAAAGKIVNDPIAGNDVEYLTGIAKDIPQTPDERRTDSQAQAVRDFGTRYASDHENFFQRHFESAEAQGKARNDKAELMVSDFLRRVDAEKATGPRIDEIAKEVQGEHIKRDHPEINRLEDLPHIIVGINGKIQRVLNPDQHTKLKGRFRIVPAHQVAEKP